MELTVNQVLQKGVDAHKAGQVQEADAPSLHSQALLEALYGILQWWLRLGFYVRSARVLPDVEGFKSALRTYIHLIPC